MGRKTVVSPTTSNFDPALPTLTPNRFLPSIELPLGPQVTNRLRHHPFNASPRVGYTDDEFKEKYGEDAYKKLVLGRIEQRRRWGQKLPKNETEFLKRYPELDTEA